VLFFTRIVGVGSFTGDLLVAQQTYTLSLFTHSKLRHPEVKNLFAQPSKRRKKCPKKVLGIAESHRFFKTPASGKWTGTLTSKPDPKVNVTDSESTALGKARSAPLTVAY